MLHLRKHVDAHVDPGGTGEFSQPGGVVEQCLLVAYLDIDGWQSGEVGMQRSGQRVVRGLPVEEQVGHHLESRAVDHQIHMGPAGHRLARTLQVDPRRQRHGGDRMGQTLIPDGQQRGNGETTSS